MIRKWHIIASYDDQTYPSNSLWSPICLGCLLAISLDILCSILTLIPCYHTSKYRQNMLRSIIMDTEAKRIKQKYFVNHSPLVGDV